MTGKRRLEIAMCLYSAACGGMVSFLVSALYIKDVISPAATVAIGVPLPLLFGWIFSLLLQGENPPARSTYNPWTDHEQADPMGDLIRYMERSGCRIRCNECPRVYDGMYHMGEHATPESTSRLARIAGWEIYPATSGALCPSCLEKNRAEAVFEAEIARKDAARDRPDDVCRGVSGEGPGSHSGL